MIPGSASAPFKFRPSNKIQVLVLSCYNHMKTITLDEEAYYLLVSRKVGSRDSFSRVVKAHFGTIGHLRASAATWADMTRADVERLRRETVRTFDPPSRRERGTGNGRHSRRLQRPD
jgi:predicted CopG family antitoxin